MHLKLTGDFDGSSACQLLEFLNTRANGVYSIVIHTSLLKNIYPFGRNIFRQNLGNLDGNSHRPQILFTGENASLLAPQKDL